MTDQPPSDFLERCEARLGPCALRSADSGGRTVPESEHPYRTCYQRDRDRIVHCSGFRRLASKTQVFVPHEQDHFRTRLTHTLEVAQIARTMARALAANEDAAEAAALAHDLGHPPFGHAGETVLNDLMTGHGGFEHNLHSLRVVDYLEHPYHGFRGLNLTRAVRDCLARHQSRYDHPADDEFAGRPNAPLEGQLVDLADEIAYTSADIYDALAAEWIDTDQLGELELWRQTADKAERALPDARPIHKRIRTCHDLLAILTDSVVTETARRIDRMTLKSPDDVQRAPQRCVAFAEKLARSVRPLQDLLMERVYRHPVSVRHSNRARRVIAGLFGAYLAEPKLLPGRYRARIDAGTDDEHRVVCDYVAGMTDRYARDQYLSLAGPDGQ